MVAAAARCARRPPAARAAAHPERPQRARPQPPRARPLASPPPDGFDAVAACAADDAWLAARHPSLAPLVASGALHCVRRPDTVPGAGPDAYVERRTDGYVEPELVVVLGSSHLSERSAEHADAVVRALEPQSVVVEVCRSRAALLDDESDAGDLSISGRDGAVGTAAMAVARSLRLGGSAAMLMRVAMASSADALAEGAGQRAGGEFRAAARAAEAVGAEVVLGDRPLEITLQRAFAALSPLDRLRFAAKMAASAAEARRAGSEAVREAIEAARTEDSVLDAAVAELQSSFPAILRPLVWERDVYLAWSLKRSKAVCGTKAVVGVVGKGHLRGVVHALKADHGDLRFKDLTGGARSRLKPPSKREVAARLAREAALLAGCYALWEALRPVLAMG